METLDIHGINAEGVECVIIRNVSFHQSSIFSLFHDDDSNRHLYVKNKTPLEVLTLP
jgi:hypothetical protein